MDNKEIISRLKFLGKVRENEKINVMYMFVQSDDVVTKFSRTFYNKDNRGNTLCFVRDIVNRSFEIVSSYINSQKLFEKAMCQNIVDDLQLAKNGIINLKNTYISDIKFNCDMDTVIQDIDAKILELEEHGIINLKESLS